MVVEAWLVGADFTSGSPPHFISSILIVPISFTGRFKKHPFEALVAAYNASQLFFDNLVDTKWQKIVEKVLS